MILSFQTRRGLLKILLWTIVYWGIACVCFLWVWAEPDDRERVVESLAVVIGTAMLSLGSGVVWAERRWHPMGLLGVCAAGLAFMVTLTAIWTDGEWPRLRHEYQIVGIAGATSLALTHIGLLGLTQLKRTYAWVRVVTAIGVALLAAITDAWFAAEGLPEVGTRIMGVLAVCVAGGTIVVPILHRMSRLDVRVATRTTELTLSLLCPRCQLMQQVSAGHSKCAGCGLKFALELQEEHCARCGYSLYKLESPNCPECGAPVGP